PVTLATGDDLAAVERVSTASIISYVKGLGQPAALIDSVTGGHSAGLLLSLFQARTSARGEGRTQGTAHAALKKLMTEGVPPAKPTQFEQTNSTLLFGDQLLLKLYRQIEPGTNSELEIGEYLTDKAPDA